MSPVDLDTLGVWAYWTEHHVTAGEYIEQVFAFLSMLTDVSPHFRNPLLVSETIEFEPAPRSHEEFKRVALSRLQKDDTWYLRRDGVKQTSVTVDSYCMSGFYMSFMYDEADWAIKLSIYGGNSVRANRDVWQVDEPTPNSVVIDCPIKEFTDPELVRTMFVRTVEHWRPTIGWVATRSFREAVEGDLQIPIGWFNYFRDREIVKFLPGDLRTETASADGGLLFSLGDRSPSAGNPADIEQSIRIREIVREHLGDPLARESRRTED
jgi:hypothetical protein